MSYLLAHPDAIGHVVSGLVVLLFVLLYLAEHRRSAKAIALLNAAPPPTRPRLDTQLGLEIADRAALRAAEIVQGPPKAHPATGRFVEELGQIIRRLDDLQGAHSSIGAALGTARLDLQEAIERHHFDVWGDAPAAVPAPNVSQRPLDPADVLPPGLTAPAPAPIPAAPIPAAATVEQSKLVSSPSEPVTPAPDPQPPVA